MTVVLMDEYCYPFKHLIAPSGVDCARKDKLIFDKKLGK